MNFSGELLLLVNHYKKHFKIIFFLLFVFSSFSYSQTSKTLVNSKSDTFSNSENANYLYHLAEEQIKVNHYDSAIIYLNNVLGVLQQKNDPVLEAEVFNKLGLSYNHMAIYDKALEYYLNALKYYESKDSVKKIISVKIGIGLLYNSSKHYQLSLKYTQEAIDLIEFNKKNVLHEELLAFAYNNKGMVLQNLGSPDSSLAYYQKALAIKRRLGNLISISYTLNNIAIIYNEKKDYDQALDYYFQSLSIKKKLKNHFGMANCFTNIGLLYDNMGDYKNALKYQDSAIAIVNKYNNRAIRAAIYLNLSAVYAHMHYDVEAFEYLKKYTQISDSIKSDVSEEKLASLQVLYETEKKQKEIELSNAKVEYLEKQTENKQNVLMLVILIVLLLCTVIVFLIRNFRLKTSNFIQKEKLFQEKQQIQKLENEQLKNELELKNAELVSFSMQSLQKRESIIQFKDKIEGVLNEEKSLTTNSLFKEKIENLAQGILTDGDDWEKFRFKLESVYPAFFNTLVSLNVDLSNTDIRHCAYIKIGLSTKEIASLLSIAPESVQKSRVRLKKKLQLDRNSDLLQYIKEI